MDFGSMIMNELLGALGLAVKIFVWVFSNLIAWNRKY